MDLPKRKPNRLREYDYSTPGAYFLTLCTKNKQCVLGQIVGGGALDAPHMQLTNAGKVAYAHILSGNNIPSVTVDKFVIMPNHIHMILFVDDSVCRGPSRAPAPTNAVIPHFISTFKRFCNRDLDEAIFQRSYHDHVIRSNTDYLKIWQYIDSNPAKWKEDCFYIRQQEEDYASY